MVCKILEKLSLSVLICIINFLFYTVFSTPEQLNVKSNQGPVKDPLQKYLDLDAAATFSVDNYGAKGDAVSDDSEAFLAAWNASCQSSSSSVFLVPYGKKYLVKPINFNGPCQNGNLTAQISGTIVAPADPATWSNQDLSSWLKFSTVKGLTINGGGIIDGCGQKWWACKKDQSCQNVPTGFVLDSCANAWVRDLTFQNSPEMHVELSLSTNVGVESLQIVAPGNSPNTDGIHVSASQHILIQNCTIATGDDCVSIVTQSSDIQIKNLTCGPGHGISIGSLGEDNSRNTVSDVVVNGASLTGTQNGVRIKTWQGGSGYAQGIIFQHVRMINVSNPIIIDQYYCTSSTPCQNQTSAVQVNNVTYTDITGTSATQEAIKLACSETVPCTNIVMGGISLHLDNGDTATSFSLNAHGSSDGQVIPPVNFSSLSLSASN